MKRTCVILTAVLLAAGMPELRAELANAIEAIVDEGVITYHEVYALNQQTWDVLVRRYRNEPATLEKKVDQMRGENLEKLMEVQLILHEFKTAGYNLPDSVIDDMVKERIKSQFGDRAKMTKTLEEQGITYEKFRQQVRERFIVEALRAKNISSEIIISPHKVEVYYEAHKDEFKVEDSVKLRVIVLKASDDPNEPVAVKMGEELVGRLKDGVPFAELASQYSQGSQKSQGGDWSWQERSKLTMGLADVAFALPVGKFSGLFSRSAGDDYWVYQYENAQAVSGKHYGVDPTTKKQSLLEQRTFADTNAVASLPPPTEYYLMQVEDRRPEHFKPLSEVRPEIENTLKLVEHDRIEKLWIERLKKKTFVRRFS